MLPRQNRLPAYTRLIHPKIASSPYFVLKYVDNDEEISRWKVVVSKKVDKKAVERNRLKRVFTKVFQNNLTSFQSGFDFLCIVHPQSRGLPGEIIEKELKFLWEKNGLISE